MSPVRLVNQCDLPQAIDLMSAWGFQYKTVLTWLKPGLGLGAYFRNTTEHCIRLYAMASFSFSGKNFIALWSELPIDRSLRCSPEDATQAGRRGEQASWKR